MSIIARLSHKRVFIAFRHLNASLLINAGVDVKTVQSCLGHSTPTTTLQIYSHSFQAAQAAAMDCIANSIHLKASNEEYIS